MKLYINTGISSETRMPSKDDIIIIITDIGIGKYIVNDISWNNIVKNLY